MLNIIADTVVVQHTAHSNPPMPIILFWILLLLWAIGGLIPVGEPFRTNVARGTTIVALILFAILGFYTFGNPAN